MSQEGKERARRWFCVFFLPIFLSLFLQAPLRAQGGGEPTQKRDIAFIGLHGGLFSPLQKAATVLGLKIAYISDEEIQSESVNFASFRLVVIQHARSELLDHYRKLFRKALLVHPKLKILDLSGIAGKRLGRLKSQGILRFDPKLKPYYSVPPENLKRLLLFLKVRYLGGAGKVLPPLSRDRLRIAYPGRKQRFVDVSSFLAWRQKTMPDCLQRPRVAISVHETHLSFQDTAVVKALVKSLEERGILSAVFVDPGPQYEAQLLAFKPMVVIHTCHGRESVAFRKKLGALHVQCLFFRKQSIKDWEVSNEGLAPNELAFEIATQETLGQIEPLAGSGTEHGGGGAEAFRPIPERIAHICDRVLSWIRLRKKTPATKKVAIFYWDREMGKSELMRGSATGMHLNGPKSLVAVLKAMKLAGYKVDPLPKNKEELVAWMMDRGRQIGVWAPEVLERLARSGKAMLVPLERYRKWFRTKVPPRVRQEVLKRWGPPPGRFMVWENQGKKFIVIPRIELGNVVLLPQPLKGEAHDSSRIHDKTIPPPHNYLATYFWIQEGFAADALIHFGTHGTEFLFPTKPTALSQADWSDVLMGKLPNINPWVINNLGESSPVRRRAYGVLIDHLVPPSVSAGLSDELANLHGDIDKWVSLEEGALKRSFQTQITEQVKKLHLDRDLHLDLSKKGLLRPGEIKKLVAYLHKIHNETTPVSMHVLGSPPKQELVVPWVVTCLRKPFMDALGNVVKVPPSEQLSPGDREKYLRKKGEAAVALFLQKDLSPKVALAKVGVRFSGSLSKKLTESFSLARRLAKGFAAAPAEIQNLLKALDGRFIPPGPSNSPDRNPAVLPTGRNMFLLNPMEVPTRPSWEIGKKLMDQLLADFFRRKGHYPERVAFTLNSFATFQDYGVMEAQILWALGLRPVWDGRNLVTDLELVPGTELGRPRVDVFLSVLGYYRDMLPSRMRLLDKGIRMILAGDPDAHSLQKHTEAMRKRLLAEGLSPKEAERMAKGRIFGRAPADMGSGAYYYLVERSGEWDKREELMETYIHHSSHVYTDGMWGKEARTAFEGQLQGTEILLRSWSDRTRSPLSNKYDWYKGGSLSMAIKHVTGKEPEWFFSDVRDPDRTSMVRAEDALRMDFRVRLFNRKWLEGMMREGYAGADMIATHVSNAYGWKIMRPGAVSDDLFERIVDVLVRDKKKLGLKEWFEKVNPFAAQEIHEILLEVIRKGYWKPDPATLRELAEGFAESVKKNGENGGILGGGNKKLKAFVKKVLGDGKSSVPVVEGPVLEEKEVTDPSFPWDALLAVGIPLLLIFLGFLFRFGEPRQ